MIKSKKGSCAVSRLVLTVGLNEGEVLFFESILAQIKKEKGDLSMNLYPVEVSQLSVSSITELAPEIVISTTSLSPEIRSQCKVLILIGQENEAGHSLERPLAFDHCYDLLFNLC